MEQTGPGSRVGRTGSLEKTEVVPQTAEAVGELGHWIGQQILGIGYRFRADDDPYSDSTIDPAGLRLAVDIPHALAVAGEQESGIGIVAARSPAMVGVHADGP